MASGLRSLVGTMTPSAVLTALQAQLQAQQDATSAQAQQAAGAASEAGTAYQNAAAQPSPEVDPMSAFFPTLFGHIAATIARDPSYVTRAHQNIQSDQNALLAARKQNLQALHDNYEQKAKAAEQLGNTDAVIENRSKLAQVQKQMEVVLKNSELGAAADRVAAEQKGAGERNAATNATTLEAARIRANATRAAAATNAPDLNDYLDESPGGVKYLNPAKVPAIKVRQALVDQARKGKVPVTDANSQSAITQVGDALGNIAVMRALVPALPADVAQRDNPLEYAKRSAMAASQAESDYAKINAQRVTAIQLDQTIGGLGKGMRINQAMIQMALKNDVPTIHDTQEWANAKLDTREALVKQVERAALGLPPDLPMIQRLVGVSRRLSKGPPKAKAATGQVQRWVSDGKGGFVPANH